MAMMDEKANPDEDFINMMKDYVATYGEKNPSTDGFQKIVEKHLTPDWADEGRENGLVLQPGCTGL